MVLPSLGTWVYFDLLAGSGAARAVYLATKGVQLGLVVGVVVAGRRRRGDAGAPAAGRRRDGWWAGAASGALLAAAILAVFHLLHSTLADGPLVAGVGRKLADFGLEGAAAYGAFATALSTAHAFLEEAYWRWLVYGGLRRLLSPGGAALLSALAFAAHHVLVLDQLFGRAAFLAATLPAAAAIAAAGLLWAWLYERTGSLVAPWVSHLAADAAVMAVGYALVWGGS